MSAPLNMRFKRRLECMVQPGWDGDLYDQWLRDKTVPSLGYPEWIVQLDNPGVEIPGLGETWSGWEPEPEKPFK